MIKSFVLATGRLKPPCRDVPEYSFMPKAPVFMLQIAKTRGTHTRKILPVDYENIA